MFSEQMAAPGEREQLLEWSGGGHSEKEYSEIVKQGSGATFLGGIVLKYAALHPEDPRVPEACTWWCALRDIGCKR